MHKATINITNSDVSLHFFYYTPLTAFLKI